MMILRTTAAALCCGLALTGCASKPKTSAFPEAATTGSTGLAAPEQADAVSAPGGPLALQAQLSSAAGDRVFFDYDSFALDDAAHAVLGRQARWLSSHSDVAVLIAGNSDERGTREYNLALGARRAESVRRALVQFGVAGDRIQTISYGKDRPDADGAGEEAWKLNRNAHTVVTEHASRP